MNTAIVKFESNRGKAGLYACYVNGKFVSSSKSKNYFEHLKKLGKVEFNNVSTFHYEEHNIINEAFNKEDNKSNIDNKAYFPINERFDILNNFVEMVANKNTASLVISGRGGLGKTHTVLQKIHSLGFEKPKVDIIEEHEELIEDEEILADKQYTIVKGFSTARGLYQTLYENRHSLIIFDDCDSILKDKTAVNILKAALDSYDVREISWNSENFRSDLPTSFIFAGSIIFISNMSINEIPQPILSRCLLADVSMTRHELIERMEVISQSEEFLPEYDSEVKSDVIDFMKTLLNDHRITELNLRSLIISCKIRFSNPNNWERLAYYTLINSKAD